MPRLESERNTAATAMSNYRAVFPDFSRASEGEGSDDRRERERCKQHGPIFMLINIMFFCIM